MGRTFWWQWRRGQENSSNRWNVCIIELVSLFTNFSDIDTRLLGIVDFQQPPSAKKTPEPRKVKRKFKKVKERRFHCKRSDSVVSPEFSAESNFVCLKCSAETKLSRTFAENHLRKHRLVVGRFDLWFPPLCWLMFFYKLIELF